jgi:hypothetical protein
LYFLNKNDVCLIWLLQHERGNQVLDFRLKERGDPYKALVWWFVSMNGCLDV